MKRRKSDVVRNERSLRRRTEAEATENSQSPLFRIPASIFDLHILGALAPHHNQLDSLLLSTDGIQSKRHDPWLQALQTVCRQWNVLLQAQARNFSRRYRCLDLCTTAAIRREAAIFGDESRDADVRQLDLLTGFLHYAENQESRYNMTPGFLSLKTFSNLDQHALESFPWRTRLARFSNVVRLDLSFLVSKLLPTVLQVSASACPQVQALVLPYEPYRDPTVSRTDVITSIIGGLEKWHASCGGLRVLHVRWLPEEVNPSLDLLLGGIVSYCPRLQCLSGFQQAFGLASASVWSTFCDTLRELREFEWQLVPLSVDNINTFVSTRKPRLELLQLNDIGAREAHVTDILAALGNAWSVLPALRSLTVNITRKTTPPHSEVLAAVADFCTRIKNECLELRELKYSLRFPLCAGAMPVADLISIAARPNIRQLEITPVQISESILVELVEAVNRHDNHRRVIELRAAASCHHAILAFLQHLASSCINFEQTSLRMKVSFAQSSEWVVEAVNASELVSIDVLQGLVDRVNALYVSTTVRLLILAWRKDNAVEFTHFHLYVGAPEREWREWRKDDATVCDVVQRRHPDSATMAMFVSR